VGALASMSKVLSFHMNERQVFLMFKVIQTLSDTSNFSAGVRDKFAEKSILCKGTGEWFREIIAISNEVKVELSRMQHIVTPKPLPPPLPPPVEVQPTNSPPLLNESLHYNMKQLAEVSKIPYDVIKDAVNSKVMRSFRRHETARPTVAGSWFLEWYNKHYR
jgi:hypothetical protein